MRNEKAIFQVQIPAKLILFGEWGVLKGYPALGCSLAKYFEVKLEAGPQDFFFIQSHDLNFEWKLLDDNPPPFLEKTCQIFHYLFKSPLEEFRGERITLTRNWDLSEGLGSSSALFLGLALLKFHRNKNESEKSFISKNIFEKAKVLQKLLLAFQKSGSGFDILLQSLGGFLSVEGCGDTLKIDRRELHLNEEVIFVHTGRKMKTDIALRELKQDPEIFKAIGKSCENFLATSDWEKTISDHQQLLSQLGVVPAFVRELEDDWKDKQWIRALKTTGAGGGDTLMLAINACKRPQLEADIKAKGFWLEEAELGVKGSLEYETN